MPQVNQRISEYVLDQKIGAGTFGEVWRAHHHVWMDQFVAIKIPTDVQYVRNLQREGVAIHGLVHPNVVRAIGFDPYADPPYLVMEYIPGMSLRGLIQQGKVQPADAVAILQQVLAGLGYAHSQGLVHRDVKPENILIHEKSRSAGYAAEGVVKVTDFGLGRVATTTAVGSIVYSASLDDAAGREIAGSLDYMSPEQRAGEEVDARADLYACGVVLFEMLTGERPAGTDVPSEINPSVPKYLDDVFRRSYARLEKRFPSAQEFAQALAPSSAPPAVSPMPAGGTHLTVTRVTCPRCQQRVESGDQFCMHCGQQLVKEVKRCGRCGAYPDPLDRFCIFCGNELAPVHASAFEA